VYGSSPLGGALATVLALTEAHSLRGAGRYPTGLVTTDSLFDFSPLAITSLHPSVTAPSHSSPSQDTLKIRQLFNNPASTLDPLASPLLLFRGSAFHTSAFPGSWVPSPSPPLSPDFSRGDDVDWVLDPYGPDPRDVAAPASLPLSEERRGDEEEEVVVRVDANEDPTRAQKRSYLKFPPANSGLRLPMCNFQISHPLPPSSPKSTKSKSKSKSATPPTATTEEAEAPAPLETTQAQLMASSINRSVRMGYDWEYGRRDNDGEGEERAVVSVLDGEGEIEEKGAVGAGEWLREGMDWR
ncbi:hypothetical protein V495_01977, partial [Pseudogymnoascus sp. VKM F-4514 (FW-929)]